MAPEPESLVLQILRDMRADMSGMRAELKGDIADLKSELKDDIADVRSDMQSLRADMAADLIVTRKELGEQIVGLRRAVIEYHTTVIGHGVLISEFEGRLRRVEQHLDLA